VILFNCIRPPINTTEVEKVLELFILGHLNIYFHGTYSFNQIKFQYAINTLSTYDKIVIHAYFNHMLNIISCPKFGIQYVFDKNREGGEVRSVG